MGCICGACWAAFTRAGMKRLIGACFWSANLFSIWCSPRRRRCSSCCCEPGLPGMRTTACESRASVCGNTPSVRAPPFSRRRKSNSSVCGICGVAFASRTAEAESRVRAMTAAMRHRGPDDEGFLAGNPRAPGLALGMRRLSIIDLAGGHQPIWNETKDVAVIFNGELYNYRDLRERLSLFGHRFTTQSDTEILVHAWEEWGEDALTELRGMFARARGPCALARFLPWHCARANRVVSLLPRKACGRFWMTQYARISSPTCRWDCSYRVGWPPAQSVRLRPKHGVGSRVLH